jgi:hypothetical protein
MSMLKTMCGMCRGVALLMAVSLPAAVSWLPAHAQPSIESLAQLEAVYVADPAAPWFESWARANFKASDWLHRPDIRIKAGADLVAAVTTAPSTVGLLTRGELLRLHAAGAPPATAAATGLSVCVGLAVNDARTEENFGDFALSRDAIDVLATPDTLAIAEALIEAHRFQGRMTPRQVKPSLALAELASGKPVLAMLPVLPDARLNMPGSDASPRLIALTETAIQALQLRGLVASGYRTSFFQQFPFIHGIRTACDEIVLITAPDGAVASDVFRAPTPPWGNPLAGSDLEKQVLQAWHSLKLLWQKPAETRG